MADNIERIFHGNFDGTVDPKYKPKRTLAELIGSPGEDFMQLNETELTDHLFERQSTTAPASEVFNMNEFVRTQPVSTGCMPDELEDRALSEWRDRRRQFLSTFNDELARQLVTKTVNSAKDELILAMNNLRGSIDRSKFYELSGEVTTFISRNSKTKTDDIIAKINQMEDMFSSIERLATIAYNRSQDI